MRKLRTSIETDRRANRRYPITLQVRWKSVRGRRQLGTGDGLTVDLSSGGLLFESDQQLQPGDRLELSIEWPVLLNDRAPLQLIAVGHVVRIDGRRVGVRIKQLDFRTVAISAQRRPPAAPVSMRTESHRSGQKRL